MKTNINIREVLFDRPHPVNGLVCIRDGVVWVDGSDGFPIPLPLNFRSEHSPSDLGAFRSRGSLNVRTHPHYPGLSG